MKGAQLSCTTYIHVVYTRRVGTASGNAAGKVQLSPQQPSAEYWPESSQLFIGEAIICRPLPAVVLRSSTPLQANPCPFGDYGSKASLVIAFNLGSYPSRLCPCSWAPALLSVELYIRCSALAFAPPATDAIMPAQQRYLRFGHQGGRYFGIITLGAHVNRD